MRVLAVSCSVAALLLWSVPASAHPVVVDGGRADWFAVPPSGFNLARVARDAAGQGEQLWFDERLDERTDLSAGAPNPQADIVEVIVTGDAMSLNVIVVTSGAGSAPIPLQVQIAIDVDGVAGSGQNFLGGFADTQTDPAANWEYLLQTQLTTGAATLDVLDPMFTRFPGAGTVASVPGAVELSVPWTAIGLMGPPPQLQLTVATFVEDAMGNTVDIGGAPIPNALDVASDYADQPNQTFNTFQEFTPPGMDSQINHFMRVFFEPTGEVHAPLLVTRFVSDAAVASGGEWIEIRNSTSIPIDLAGYKLGDEETPGGGEGMRLLPPATIVAAGGVFVLARVAPDYAAYYGTVPDAGLAALPAFTNWSSGTVTLSNGGDQILLLGTDNTVLDAVTYGTGAYPGTMSISPPPPNLDAAVRLPVSGDTDDNDADFTVLDSCRTVADCSGTGAPCESCARFTCRPSTLGLSCADGDVCDGDEACDGTGSCAAGTPAPSGTSCVDADLCNGDESCDGAGACMAGAPLSCDDMNACTVNLCDSMLGCQSANVADDAPCADGDVCNGDETCQTGTCVAGTALACDDTNPCTADSCDPTSGCQSVNVADATPCADADLCNGDETCAAGACVAGTILVCDDMNPCTADSCDAIAGCLVANVADDTPCVDADLCNGDETCQTGACTAGTALDCDDTNPCTADSCDATGGCASMDVADGTPCVDTDVCNGDETCQTGTCAGGTALACDDMNGCTTDSCDPSAGCQNMSIPDCLPDAGITDAGMMDPDAGTDGGMETDAGFVGDADMPFDAGPTPPGRDGGCGCHVISAPRPGTGWWILAGVGLGVALRRRRRRTN